MEPLQPFSAIDMAHENAHQHIKALLHPQLSFSLLWDATPGIPKKVIFTMLDIKPEGEDWIPILPGPKISDSGQITIPIGGVGQNSLDIYFRVKMASSLLSKMAAFLIVDGKPVLLAENTAQLKMDNKWIVELKYTINPSA